MRYCLSPSPNVSARSFGDEIVAANFLSGIYYSLLGSSVQIWEGLMAGLPLDRVVAAVAPLSDAAPEDFAHAARAFVEALVAEKLIIPAEDEGEAGTAPAWEPVPPAEGRYAAPALERFDDMEDLLTLDPVHDVEDMGWPHADPARPD